MDNKSGSPVVLMNDIDPGFKNVSASGTGPFVGTSNGAEYHENKASGYEGPGRGSLTKLCSDDQMPSQTRE